MHSTVQLLAHSHSQMYFLESNKHVIYYCIVIRISCFNHKVVSLFADKLKETVVVGIYLLIALDSQLAILQP